MSDNYTVRNASGTTVTKSSKDIGSGVEADRVRLTKSDASADAEILIANAAAAENSTQYLATLSALFGTDAAATAGSKLVAVQVESTANPHLKVSVKAAGNSINPGSLAAQQAFLASGALQVVGPGEKMATANIQTGTTTPSANLAAPGASTIYVVREIQVSIAAGASAQTPLLVTLTQDKAGSPVVLWQCVLSAPVNSGENITISDVAIAQTVANKTLHLEVTAGTIVSGTFIALTFGAAITS